MTVVRFWDLKQCPVCATKNPRWLPVAVFAFGLGWMAGAARRTVLIAFVAGVVAGLLVAWRGDHVLADAAMETARQATATAKHQADVMRAIDTTLLQVCPPWRLAAEGR